MSPVAAAALVVCGLLSDTLVAIVRTSAGGTPAITVSVITALALVVGPYRGMLLGFAAGVVLDLLAGPVAGGVHALGGVVAGAVAGVIGRRGSDRLAGSPLVGVVVVPAVVLGVLTLHGLFGQPAVAMVAALRWSAVCGALVTPLICRLAGRPLSKVAVRA